VVFEQTQPERFEASRIEHSRRREVSNDDPQVIEHAAILAENPARELVNGELPRLVEECLVEAPESLHARGVNDRGRVGVDQRSQRLALALASGKRVEVLVAVVDEHAFGDGH